MSCGHEKMRKKAKKTWKIQENVKNISKTRNISSNKKILKKLKKKAKTIEKLIKNRVEDMIQKEVDRNKSRIIENQKNSKDIVQKNS